MKKVSLFLAVAMICGSLFLTACGGNSGTEKALSLSKGGKTIAYGMTREEVEKILGEPEGEGLGIDYGVMNIIYRDDKVVLMRTREKGWQVNGIGPGDSREKLLKTFDEEISLTAEAFLNSKYAASEEATAEEVTEHKNTAYILDVFYVRKDGKLTPTSVLKLREEYSEDYEAAKKALEEGYYLSFSFVEDEIDGIIIGDYQACMNMR